MNMKHKIELGLLLFAAAFLVAACAGYKRPQAKATPQSMSADTLCYRAASDKTNEALAAEVAARHLDCQGILADDPLYQGSAADPADAVGGPL